MGEVGVLLAQKAFDPSWLEKVMNGKDKESGFRCPIRI